MSTFQKCPPGIADLAREILQQFETHHPVLNAGVTIDFVFAYAKENEEGEKVGNAINHHGGKALGLCRKIPLKDRAKGLADVEITLDGDWWDTADNASQRALLDHELHHISVKIDKRGLVRDDLERPVIYLRKHDFECGWFTQVAARHGTHSIERQQAREVMDAAGQYFWPGVCGELSAAEGGFAESAATRISSLELAGQLPSSVNISAAAMPFIRKAAKELREAGQK